MIKKLLTILLSVFMLNITFTVNIFADPIKISDVLAMVDDGFPSADNITEAPANSWSNGSCKMLITTSNNQLSIVGGGVLFDLNTELTLESNNKYKFSNNGINLYFNLVNDKLVSIEITGSTIYANINGTYLAPKTIHQILTDSFPSTDLSGWGCTSSNTVLYQILPSMDSLYINQMNSTDPYIILQNQITTKVSDNQYKYHNSEAGKEFDIFFNLESGSLQSIVISGATGDLAGINGTYTTPLLVSDIIPSDFPDNETSAWTNGTFKIYLVGDEIKLDGQYSVLSLESAVRPVGDGNYHFTDHMGSLTFIMDDDKFVSIVASGFISPFDAANGTYVAPKTIADILNTVSNGFPTTKTSGWVKDGDTDGQRAYIDGSNLMLNTSDVSLNNIVIKDDNTYKCTVGSANYTFTMESNILKSITLDVLFSSSAGTYIPYKYEIEPTGSKPQGYTGTLVFKTNAQYTNPDHVIVKVNGVQLSLGQDYTVNQGSTIVTLLGNYLKNLVPDTYTISIGVQDTYDELISHFTITVSTPTPSPTPSPSNSSGLHIIPNTSVE